MKKQALVFLMAALLSSYSLSAINPQYGLKFRSENEPTDNSRSVVLPILKPTPQPTIEIKIAIPVILSEEDEGYSENQGGDDLIPAAELYEVWNNLSVNPYKVNPDSLFINDSINISLDNFYFPLPIHYRITSEFGPRRYRYHYGIDLKVNIGDTVVSVMDGMVRIAKKMKGYGNIVVVRHYNGLESFYGHLDEILVEIDQTVKAGEIIGLGGNTGRSTGPHLHLELRYLGQPINPRDIIDFSDLKAKDSLIVLNKDNFKYLKAAKAKSNSVGGRVWVIKKGDSLGRISQKTGVSVKKLCALNGITAKKVLLPGKRIKY